MQFEKFYYPNKWRNLLLITHFPSPPFQKSFLLLDFCCYSTFIFLFIFKFHLNLF